MQKKQLTLKTLIPYCFFVMFFALASCIKFEDTPIIPQIDFQSVQSDIVYDALGNESKHTKLTFNLIDGDGDIGLMPEDTIEPFVGHFRHNFHFDLMVKKQGEFVYWDELAINYFDIPYIEPQGQNKLIEAQVSIDLYFSTLLMPYDTVYFRFFVYDRALNRSNIDTSYIVVF